MLDTYDTLLLDLDGTVFNGHEPIAAAVRGIEAARDVGTTVRFVTNNASRAPDEVAAHLRGLGVPADHTEVATSAQAGAALLAQRLEPGSLVLVVGSQALATEVQAVGLSVTRAAEPGVAAVIQGHSPDTTWQNLAEACIAVRAGAHWVACNMDPTLPSERGQLPGNGSMVAALRSATGANPAVAGKPQPALFERAALTAGARNPLVVGDRLDTDIAGARAAHMAGLLVLSGVCTPLDLLSAPEPHRPQYLAADLAGVHAPGTALAIGGQPTWQVTVAETALHVSGSGADPLELLRALCEPAWSSGITAVEPAGPAAAAAIRSLGL